ncbi:MAG: hypothetical protein Ta2A_04250 [Treponemataceae bacterium]|nr:MAG: hypothetical protein Ta2A_04250 [Treponemataceae bacterium]
MTNVQKFESDIKKIIHGAAKEKALAHAENAAPKAVAKMRALFCAAFTHLGTVSAAVFDYWAIAVVDVPNEAETTRLLDMFDFLGGDFSRAKTAFSKADLREFCAFFSEEAAECEQLDMDTLSLFMGFFLEAGVV